jgi:regulator of protease activity HflC (stomatin/prohibitin superfamily)
MDGCATTSIGLALAALAVVVLSSFDTLEPTEWGLKYNSITKKLASDDVYEGGLYLLNPLNSFIVFPSTLQTIEFSDNRWAKGSALKTRTKEGLALSMSMSFQYRLLKNQLAALYSLTNAAYEQTFVRIARDVILQEAGNHEAPEYWMQRDLIGDRMLFVLNEELSKAYAEVVYVQMLFVDLPDSYELSIVATQVEVQNTRIKEYEQEAEVIRQEIAVMQSQGKQNTTVINATGTSRAYYIRKLASATVETKTIGMESWVYSQAKQLLELDSREVTDFLFYESLMLQPDAQLLVGLENVIVRVN